MEINLPQDAEIKRWLSKMAHSKSKSGWIRAERDGLDLNLVMEKGGNAIARRSAAGAGAGVWQSLPARPTSLREQRGGMDVLAARGRGRYREEERGSNIKLFKKIYF
jgi:hypothetical protein